MDKRRKQVYLDEKLNAALEQIALATGKSETAIVREALAEYVTRTNAIVLAKPNPLAELLDVASSAEVKDGSEQHDRDLYRGLNGGKTTLNQKGAEQP